MGETAASETWVGRSLPRLEDEALLRGDGRFIDDLDPVPNAHHAAVLRSPFAHARIARLDPGAALELPGVAGVLTGQDVAELSRPFAAGVDSPVPHYAAATEITRYVGEPVAVVVARDRYLAEDALELIEVEYEPLAPVLDAEAAVESEACISDRSFHYGDVDSALGRADLVVRERFRSPRWSCTPVECYSVIADWNDAAGSLTAWANFQGPFTLHSVAAGALGLPGSKLRLLTPPDSGGSFGIKSAVFVYVVLMGLASRKAGVPVRWIEDRLEHLAASSSASGRVTNVEAGFTADGELVALRYDAIEDVGAYVRAPEPATLYRMHGSLAGAYRVRNVGARNRVVVTNTMPSGLNRGFGGPQLYLALERTMTIAAKRLELDPAEVRRRNLIPAEAFPYRTPSGALYDSGDYEACLDDALGLARYDERRLEAEAARANERLVGVGIACVVEPSISNMGYITLAEPGETRGLPKSGKAVTNAPTALYFRDFCVRVSGFWRCVTGGSRFRLALRHGRERDEAPAMTLGVESRSQSQEPRCLRILPCPSLSRLLPAMTRARRRRAWRPGSRPGRACGRTRTGWLTCGARACRNRCWQAGRSPRRPPRSMPTSRNGH